MFPKLTRQKQCAKCPWKKSTNPKDIPNGYSKSLHQKLRRSIAPSVEAQLRRMTTSIHLSAMACHESRKGVETFCVGWLMNQLGPGNNIGLRMAMRSFDLSGITLDGEQHETFKDTLPK
jgi:hypothetical protein